MWVLVRIGGDHYEINPRKPVDVLDMANIQIFGEELAHRILNLLNAEEVDLKLTIPDNGAN